jgi:antirestriction protein
MTLTTTPKVWIGCLASYNAGRLIGEWTEANDLDEMLDTQKQVAEQAIAAAKEAGEWPVYFTEPEEFFLADNEGFGDAIGEYTPLERVAELAEAIEEHGDAFLAFLRIRDDVDSDDVAEIVSDFENRFCGEFESMRDYAYDFVDQCGWGGFESMIDRPSGPYGQTERVGLSELPLDWDQIASELEMDHTEQDGYIFRSY